jgi:hypothetical protein
LNGAFIMDTIAIGSGRDAAGRFVAGQSGNPAGKRPGTRNRRTILMAALRDGEDVTAARVVIDKAVAGDAVAARFLVAMISPRPRGQTIHLDLPEDDCNVIAAFDATLRGLADGEITPDEAVAVSRFLGARDRVRQAGSRKATATLDPKPVVAAERGDATAADAAPTLQPTCISQAPQTAPHVATLPPTPASPLQSACISRSPGSATVSAPVGGSDAALAARMLRRLAAGAAMTVLASAANARAHASLPS